MRRIISIAVVVIAIFILVGGLTNSHGWKPKPYQIYTFCVTKRTEPLESDMLIHGILVDTTFGDFEEVVGDALNLIYERTPYWFDFTTTYIARIEWDYTSGMATYRSLPTFHIDPTTHISYEVIKKPKGRAVWVASCIVHDATHSQLY